MATAFAVNLARFQGDSSHSDLLLPASVARSNATGSRGGRCSAKRLAIVAVCVCTVILLAVHTASPSWLPELMGGRSESSRKDSSPSEFGGSETPLPSPPPPPPEHEVHGAPFTTIAFLLTLLVGCKVMCSEAPGEDGSDSTRKASVPAAASTTVTPTPAPPPPPQPQLQPQPP